MRESILLDDVYVSGGDIAAGIDVIAEVGGGDRLEGLRLTQIGVAASNNCAGVNVAKKQSHRAGNSSEVVSGRVYDIR